MTCGGVFSSGRIRNFTFCLRAQTLAVFCNPGLVCIPHFLLRQLFPHFVAVLTDLRNFPTRPLPVKTSKLPPASVNEKRGARHANAPRLKPSVVPVPALSAKCEFLLFFIPGGFG